MMRFVAVGFLCLCAFGITSAAPPYTVTEVPSPFGGEFDVTTLSESGLVAGCAEGRHGGNFAYAFEPGFGIEVLALGHSVPILDTAFDVNDEGVAVGVTTDEDFNNQAFVWRRDKGLEVVGLGGRNGFALEINDAGWVVGRASTPEGESHPFVWSRGTGAFELSWNDSGAFSFVSGFNQTGAVIGFGDEVPFVLQRPFLFTPRLGVMDPREWLPLLVPGTAFASELQDSGRLLMRGTDPDTGRRRTFLLEPAGREQLRHIAHR